MAKLQDKDFEQVSGGDMSLSELLEGATECSDMIERINKHLDTPGLSQQIKTDLRTLREKYMNNLSKFQEASKVLYDVEIKFI